MCCFAFTIERVNFKYFYLWTKKEFIPSVMVLLKVRQK